MKPPIEYRPKAPTSGGAITTITVKRDKKKHAARMRAWRAKKKAKTK